MKKKSEMGLSRTPSKFKYAIGQKVKINGKSQEFKDGQSAVVRSRFSEGGKEFYRLEGMKGKNGNYIEFAESALEVRSASKPKAASKPKPATTMETVQVPGHWVDGYSYKRKVTPKMKAIRQEFKENYVKKASKRKKK